MRLYAGVCREGVCDGALLSQFLEAAVRVRSLADYVFVEEAVDAYLAEAKMMPAEAEATDAKDEDETMGEEELPGLTERARNESYDDDTLRAHAILMQQYSAGGLGSADAAQEEEEDDEEAAAEREHEEQAALLARAQQLMRASVELD